MEKTPVIDLPTEFDVPAIPGIDWDEIHAGYRAKFERENPAASEEERFINAIEEGLADIRAGRTMSLEEARASMEKKFGIRR